MEKESSDSVDVHVVPSLTVFSLVEKCTLKSCPLHPVYIHIHIRTYTYIRTCVQYTYHIACTYYPPPIHATWQHGDLLNVYTYELDFCRQWYIHVCTYLNYANIAILCRLVQKSRKTKNDKFFSSFCIFMHMARRDKWSLSKMKGRVVKLHSTCI